MVTEREHQTKQIENKNITEDKDGHYIMIKGSVHQKDITVVNIYAPNIRVPKYIKQILTKLMRKINSNTITRGDLSNPLAAMDIASRQKIKKETVLYIKWS